MGMHVICQILEVKIMQLHSLKNETPTVVDEHVLPDKGGLG